ncbi:amino acid ABC transporter permease [Comamonas flocculans]|uniref:Amino acid ABC transporter permease n=1 Tax=Comamonas flocculans TaxID=2597701 RepID=A0A5B8RPW2_9BURK|nr:amino acid ABC transporter permease [Comamonas flocculans]QEA11576.1 amino acid ABC transporter permease [Comamonas flocculans]
MTQAQLSSVGRAPPGRSAGALGWLRSQLFSSPLNALLTVLVVWVLLMALPALVDYFFIKPDFAATTAAGCREAGGYCWALVREKHRLILFGLYPYDEQWRPLLASVILLGIIVCSAMRRFWRPALGLAWVVALVAVGVLMWGGVFGLSYVEDARWGGLPLTLILATFGIGIAFPFGVLLALGRRSNMPAVRAVCIIYIELIRGVPLISLLFMSSVMLPLFLPEGFSIDKLLRAQIALILFTAAYIAEVVRGGLQAIPRGQVEGADSLGLSYWQQMRLVVLPQALRISIPTLVSTFISLFKDTSLVVIIGIFDLMQAARAAVLDSAWQGFSIDSYIFIAVIYFVFCFSMSRYSLALERRLNQGQQR